ncbi:MAG: hypothetical protein KGL18_11660 [Burkholderiales bacterium]|nr:hypothetical protein [Burkholderiales bacterium]MDE1929106.1 hypothetical protein [Burkholderiales bacterium]MDE2159932.1 hypothetical protein [Burkholderiales bacterium]MDE2503613.1 hypothetical protein [Burkholderiales bacterium]
MFTIQNHRPDFAETQLNAADPADAAELLQRADAADRVLLQLVACAALATLVLALASSLGA